MNDKEKWSWTRFIGASLISANVAVGLGKLAFSEFYKINLEPVRVARIESENDSEIRCFYQRGLDEESIKKFKLDYADSLENVTRTEYGNAFSRDDRVLTNEILKLEDLNLLYDVQVVRDVDKHERKELDRRLWALKDLLEELNSINADEKDEFLKLRKMCHFISRRIDIYEANDLPAPIDRLFNSAKGDCDDISGAYIAILKHYNFKPYLRIAQSFNSNNNSNHHAWISVEVNGRMIDLDPTWYKSEFVPLRYDEKVANTFRIIEKN